MFRFSKYIEFLDRCILIISRALIAKYVPSNLNELIVLLISYQMVTNFDLAGSITIIEWITTIIIIVWIKYQIRQLSKFALMGTFTLQLVCY